MHRFFPTKMTGRKCFAPFMLLYFVLFGNVKGTYHRQRNPNYDWDIDFNTLLNSYLGNTPAIWLTSQSLVYEMKARYARDYGIPLFDQGTDGAAAGSYLASLLIPRFPVNTPLGRDMSKNSSFAGDICRSLVKISKATTKPTIDLETLRNRVVKSIVGHGFIIETTRNLCKNLVHGIEAAWEDNKCPWYDAELKIALDGAFQKVLSTHLTDQGINETRAVRFATELETTLRIVDSTLFLEDAFEHLMRKLVGDISALVLRGSANQSAAPSLREFTKLSDNAARRLPQGPIPVGTSQLQNSNDPVCIIGTFTEIAMGSLRIAATLGDQVEMSANSATSVMDHLHDATLVCRSGSLERKALENVVLRDESTTELKNVARAVREVVDTLPPVKLSRFYNWPEIGRPTIPQAHPRTVGRNPAYETAFSSSENLSPSPTASTPIQQKRQNFTSSLDSHQTAGIDIPPSNDPESQPVAGYIITMPYKTAYHRVPDYTADGTAYHKVPNYPFYNAHKTRGSEPNETLKDRRDTVLSSASALPTVTSTRTIIRNLPRYTTTATISYTTTSTVTSTYTDYECKHGTVKQCHVQYIRLCWYNLL